MAKRATPIEMKVIPRFVYDPEKAERGLKALADILVHAMQVNHPEMDSAGSSPKE